MREQPPIQQALQLEWSDDQPPVEGGCRYSHCTAQTPLGVYRVEWKSWKQSEGYDLYLDYEYIDFCTSKADAQQLALKHLVSVAQQLTPYIQRDTSL